MRQKSLFIRGILGTALVFALIFTACDNNPTGDPKPNLTNLNAKIAEAESAKGGVQRAASAGEVVQSRKWVPASVMDTFNVAIQTAKNALNAATQAEVDSAVTALNAAITAFNSAKRIGNKTSGFTQPELSDLIAEASTALIGIEESEDGKDVSPQDYWVTDTVMDALKSALDATQNPGGNIDSVYKALDTALNDFYTAKQPGTGKPITITDLDFPDGTEIEFALFVAEFTGTETEFALFVPEFAGKTVSDTLWEIQDNRVTVILHTSETWTGSGSYYAAFRLATVPLKVYTSKSKITFNDDVRLDKTLAFSDFKPFVFKYTLGDFAEKMGIPITSNEITLDGWCKQMSIERMSEEMTYADMLEAGYIPGQLYKDEALTQPFSGSDILYANTPIYSEFMNN